MKNMYESPQSNKYKKDPAYVPPGATERYLAVQENIKKLEEEEKLKEKIRKGEIKLLKSEKSKGGVQKRLNENVTPEIIEEYFKHQREENN